ncbi:MAG: hypothetical protein WBM44_11715 [Waterburya sp.]
MSMLEKAIDLGDDVGAKLIMRASEKRKRVNALLEQESSDVRISSFEIQMGTPPSVTFCIEPVLDKSDK